MFASGRQQFFRPLTLKKRGLIAACIRAFYQRLYGSHADYRSTLGREELRDLFVQTIQTDGARTERDDNAGEEGFAPADLADDQKMASAFIRQLVADGWLETAQSHAPDEAKKSGQTDPGQTGCRYADAVLLPALRQHERFVDQESL